METAIHVISKDPNDGEPGQAVDDVSRRETLIVNTHHFTAKIHNFPGYLTEYPTSRRKLGRLGYLTDFMAQKHRM